MLGLATVTDFAPVSSLVAFMAIAIEDFLPGLLSVAAAAALRLGGRDVQSPLRCRKSLSAALTTSNSGSSMLYRDGTSRVFSMLNTANIPTAITDRATPIAPRTMGMVINELLEQAIALHHMQCVST